MRTLRETTPLMHGPDVRELQRLLVKVKRLPAKNVDGQYGPETGTAVYQAKTFDFGYAKPDRTASALLISYLKGEKKLDAAQRKRKTQRYAKLKATETAAKRRLAARAARENTMRRTAVRVMDILLAHERPIHYAQIRLMQTRYINTIAELLHALEHGISMDCSESATLIARLAGARNPNHGMPLGVGNTETLKSGPHISRSQLRPGDFVIFGPGYGHHVCNALESGYSTPLFSHGWEGAPQDVPFDIEAAHQPSPITCVRMELP